MQKMADAFNFRDLGQHNSRRFIIERAEVHILYISNAYSQEDVIKCRCALAKGLDYANGKIDGHELLKVRKEFREEFFRDVDGFAQANIKPLSLQGKITDDLVTQAFLLLSIVDNCCSPTPMPRETLALIGGFVALSERWYGIERERAAQIRLYKKYMAEKTQKREQGLSVLHTNRRISFAEEKK
jgi:hypothetical protein